MQRCECQGLGESSPPRDASVGTTGGQYNMQGAEVGDDTGCAMEELCVVDCI